MVEAVGLAASILQIAGAGTKLSTSLYNFARSALRADQEVEDIANDVEITANALDSIGRVFNNENTKSVITKEAVTHARSLIKRCEGVFKEIQDVVDKRRCTGKDGKKGGLSALGKLSWPMKEQKIQLQRGRLESLKNSLIVLLHVIQLANAQANGKLEKSALEEEREKIRELHQRQQDSLTSLQMLESKLSNVSLDDDGTLSRANDTARIPTVGFTVTSQVPRSSMKHANDGNKTKMDHTTDDSETSESDDTSTDADDENLTTEDLSKCAKHVQKLLRRISSLQHSLDTQKTPQASRYPKKKVHKLYRRFCRKFEEEMVSVTATKSIISYPLPAFNPSSSVIAVPEETATSPSMVDQRTPTNEKPYQCTECKRDFSRHDLLLRHGKFHARAASMRPRASTITHVDPTALNNPLASRNISCSRSPKGKPRADPAVENRISSNSTENTMSAGSLPQSPSAVELIEYTTSHQVLPYIVSTNPMLLDLESPPTSPLAFREVDPNMKSAGIDSHIRLPHVQGSVTRAASAGANEGTMKTHPGQAAMLGSGPKKESTVPGNVAPSSKSSANELGVATSANPTIEANTGLRYTLRSSRPALRPPPGPDIGEKNPAAGTKLRKRTKTACLTCRKRRIKCGEERPTCANCIKSKRQCEGYNNRVIFRPPIGDWPNHPGVVSTLQYHDSVLPGSRVKHPHQPVDHPPTYGAYQQPLSSPIQAEMYGPLPLQQQYQPSPTGLTSPTRSAIQPRALAHSGAPKRSYDWTASNTNIHPNHAFDRYSIDLPENDPHSPLSNDEKRQMLEKHHSRRPSPPVHRMSSPQPLQDSQQDAPNARRFNDAFQPWNNPFSPTDDGRSMDVEPWKFPSRAPVSSTSTIAYTWSSNDKNGKSGGVDPHHQENESDPTQAQQPATYRLGIMHPDMEIQKAQYNSGQYSRLADCPSPRSFIPPGRVSAQWSLSHETPIWTETDTDSKIVPTVDDFSVPTASSQRTRDQQVLRATVVENMIEDSSEGDDYKHSPGIRLRPGHRQRRGIMDFQSPNAVPDETDRQDDATVTKPIPYIREDDGRSVLLDPPHLGSRIHPMPLSTIEAWPPPTMYESMHSHSATVNPAALNVAGSFTAPPIFMTSDLDAFPAARRRRSRSEFDLGSEHSNLEDNNVGLPGNVPPYGQLPFIQYTEHASDESVGDSYLSYLGYSCDEDSEEEGLKHGRGDAVVETIATVAGADIEDDKQGKHATLAAAAGVTVPFKDPRSISSSGQSQGESTPFEKTTAEDAVTDHNNTCINKSITASQQLSIAAQTRKRSFSSTFDTKHITERLLQGARPHPGPASYSYNASYDTTDLIEPMDKSTMSYRRAARRRGHPPKRAATSPERKTSPSTSRSRVSSGHFKNPLPPPQSTSGTLQAPTEQWKENHASESGTGWTDVRKHTTSDSRDVTNQPLNTHSGQSLHIRSNTDSSRLQHSDINRDEDEYTKLLESTPETASPISPRSSVYGMSLCEKSGTDMNDDLGDFSESENADWGVWQRDRDRDPDTNGTRDIVDILLSRWTTIPLGTAC
ncbi:hypothetical protein K491DRAFT_718811 [Lophiostoma macrostomum CBS 122681]|uniref:Zn(2)-C6 fungal-type domain-containing protein n=1 Tax=Lophiostoma macrostomum CBS 122681 TaxID=1314788 RepID=A0A6A6SZV4_9PLEO|nr:hypothetical protein K491DRAFT_718811 [Lophiostoma macrostomum CBS 122681]